MPNKPATIIFNIIARAIRIDKLISLNQIWTIIAAMTANIIPFKIPITNSLLTTLKKLLDESFAEAEWIKAHRYRREQYSLTGSDGKLSYKMPKNSFPQDIIDLIK